MHTYIHTYIQTYTHTCIHTYIHTHIRLYIHAWMQCIHTLMARCLRDACIRDLGDTCMRIHAFVDKIVGGWIHACIQSWTEYLRQTLVFMWNSRLWERFNFYFCLGFCYWGARLQFYEVWDFPDISQDPKPYVVHHLVG